jgi:hypothetical protein
MNWTPARKRKREFKKFLGLAAVVLVIVGVFGAGGYYLYITNVKKPLYVSPLSTKALNVNDEKTPSDVLKKELQQKKIAFTDVKTASNSSLLVSLKDGGVVTFSSEKDILTQVSSLQFILSRLTMEGREVRSLDLRFSKPVIVFAK